MAATSSSVRMRRSMTGSSASAASPWVAAASLSRLRTLGGDGGESALPPEAGVIAGRSWEESFIPALLSCRVAWARDDLPETTRRGHVDTGDGIMYRLAPLDGQ